MALTPYTPTTWVNDSEPDINATNLNKIEQGIQSAVGGVNGILNSLTNQLSTDTTKFAGIAVVNSSLTALNAKEIQFKPTVNPVFASTNDLASGAEVLFTVTFDKAFSSVPAVTFTLRASGDNFLTQIGGITTTGFTGYIRNPFSSSRPVSGVSLSYIAMC